MFKSIDVLIFLSIVFIPSLWFLLYKISGYLCELATASRYITKYIHVISLCHEEKRGIVIKRLFEIGGAERSRKEVEKE